jgi:hypothetical protein
MNHVVNHHSPPKKKYADLTASLEKRLSHFIQSGIDSISKQQQPAFDEALQLQHFITKKIDELVTDIQNDDLGNKMGLLQTRLLLELRDLADAVLSLQKVYSTYS